MIKVRENRFLATKQSYGLKLVITVIQFDSIRCFQDFQSIRSYQHFIALLIKYESERKSI